MTDEREPQNEVAAAMLPPLLHRIQNTTQLLLALRSLIGRSGAGSPQELGESLAEASRAADEQGWLIGLLARSMGTDLLLAREERDALRISLRLVSDWARQSRGQLELPTSWPRLALAAGAPRSAELALDTLELVWRSLEPEQHSRLTFERTADAVRLELEAAGCGRGASSFAKGSLARAGARLETRDGAWTLTLPAAWFEGLA